jgi:hypothetical protein
MEDQVTMVEALIPISAIVMGIGIAMLGLWLDYRKKSEIYALHHKERMAAIEKGMDVPPLPPELFQRGAYGRTSADFLRRGIVWLLIGGSLLIAMLLEGTHGAMYALIPAAIGLANLIFYFLQPRIPVPPKV